MGIVKVKYKCDVCSGDPCYIAKAIP